MSHTCHAHGCDVPILPRQFMCRKHWFMLRKPMQRAIWREYREGQEVDKNPSLRYLAVQQRAVSEVAPTADASRYIQVSERYRKLAIDAGDGDPLKDLVKE